MQRCEPTSKANHYASDAARSIHSHSSVVEERSIVVKVDARVIAPDGRDAAAQNLTRAFRALRTEAVHPEHPVDGSQQPLMLAGTQGDVRHFRRDLSQRIHPLHVSLI